MVWMSHTNFALEEAHVVCMSQSLWLQQLKNGTYGNYLPTVNEVQADDCLQMAIQSLVTEVSGWVKSILGLQNGASHITVVPEVFSYVSTPPKHCPLTWLLRLSKVGNRWYQIYVVLRCLWKKKWGRFKIGKSGWIW